MNAFNYDFIIEEAVMESQFDVLISYGNIFEKSIIMESEEYNVTNVSKLKQFINWVSRTINTILAKLNKKIFEKKIEKIMSMNINAGSIQIDSAYIHMMEQLMADDSSMNKQLYSIGFGDGFKKERGKNYEKCADYLQNHKTEKIEKSMKKRNVKLNTLKTWFSFIQKQGKTMVTRLTQINEHIKLLKTNMTKEETNTSEFQQYVRMLTLTLNNDLRIVESLNGFLSDLLKLKKSEDGVSLDDDSDSETSESNNNEEQQSQAENYPPDVKETYEPPAVVYGLLNKWVFKKHPKADAIYVYLDQDGDTVKVVYNVSTSDQIKPKMHKFSLNKYKNKVPWKALATANNIERLKQGIKIPKG